MSLDITEIKGVISLDPEILFRSGPKYSGGEDEFTAAPQIVRAMYPWKTSCNLFNAPSKRCVRSRGALAACQPVCCSTPS